jgi:RNA polymerase sigma factor FliA
MDWFSRGQRHRVRTLEEAMRRLEHESGSPPSLEKLAEATGLTEREVSQGLEALQNQLCLSLDAITENIASYQKNQIDNEPYKSAEFKELVDKLASLIDDLTPREKLVLSLYYGEELNMRETSEVMGITEGRVSQLHSQALARLRQKFKAQFNIEQH